VVIGGTINISGSNGTALQGGFGGPGGFAGGNPGRLDLPPSAGSGPGGGPTNVNTSLRHAVFAVRPVDAPADFAQPYGNALLIPMIGGSGGGGSPSEGGGGGGGGAILIASSSLIRVEGTGRILAEGGYNGTGGVRSVGSGGAIRLVAPKVVGLRPLQSAEAVLSVRSADSNNAYHGRIRIDSIDRTELNFWFQPAAAASIGSFMTLQPSPRPRLGLVRAAGVDIAADSGPLSIWNSRSAVRPPRKSRSRHAISEPWCPSACDWCRRPAPRSSTPWNWITGRTGRMPDRQVADLEAESRRRKISKSDIIRERLQRHGEGLSDTGPDPLAGLRDIIGSVKGLPHDLSARKKDYLRSLRYGQDRPRG